MNVIVMLSALWQIICNFGWPQKAAVYNSRVSSKWLIWQKSFAVSKFFILDWTMIKICTSKRKEWVEYS